jgi:hypothetical protein
VPEGEEVTALLRECLDHPALAPQPENVKAALG